MKPSHSLYDEDFVRWSEDQAAAIRAAAASGTNLPLDWDNIAEEIESLGKSVRHELRNRLATIVEHLLKLEVSPAVDPRRGWMETIERERGAIEFLLAENPSLKPQLTTLIESATRQASRSAQYGLEEYGELTSAARHAVAERRFSNEEVIDRWFPERAGGP